MVRGLQSRGVQSPVVDAIRGKQRFASAAKQTETLRQKYGSQLARGRFRQINQILYSTKSTVAAQVLNEDDFKIYHAGYKSQVASWPVDPTESMIEWCRQELLPQSIIADLGCGRARLAKEIGKEYRVLSYDLAAVSSLVQRANIAELPLKDDSVDAVIFCLSLMGPDWPAFIREAWRVLKPKGRMRIAEVASRVQAGKPNGDIVHAIETVGFTSIPSETDLNGPYFVMLGFEKQMASSHSSAGSVDNLPSSLLGVCLYKKR